MKKITYEASKIAKLESTLKGKALTWYMKYRSTLNVVKTIQLETINEELLKESQKPKSKSHYIIEVKEINKTTCELVWNYDQ